MASDGDEPMEHHDDTPAGPTRDARGRWLKGHCPNRDGRPRKKPKEYRDQADIRTFGTTLIEIRANGKTEMMDRRAALNHKMFEDAMNGKVSMQKFLSQMFGKNDEQLAAAWVRYDRLIYEWIIDNPNYGKPGHDMPVEIEHEIIKLRQILNHYFPGSFDDP